MSVLIKHMAMPKGCIYANDKEQTDYCPMLNHDDVPFCQYIENEPEIAIGIDERPVYCPLSDVPDTNVEDMISKRAATTIPVMPKEHRHYQTNNLDDAYEQGWNDLQKCIENLPTIQPTNEMLERCKFEYIHACKVVSIPTPDVTGKDIQDAYAVIKALQPIFGDVPFAKVKRGDSDAVDRPTGSCKADKGQQGIRC